MGVHSYFVGMAKAFWWAFLKSKSENEKSKVEYRDLPSFEELSIIFEL